MGLFLFMVISLDKSRTGAIVSVTKGENTMICIYHEADSDSKHSAEIVKTRYPDIELYGIRHFDEVPDLSEYNKNIAIIVVGFSFEGMEEFPYLVWIDNNKMAIDKFPNTINGLRDTKRTTCVMVTEWFFGSKKPKNRTVKITGIKPTASVIRCIQHLMKENGCGVTDAKRFLDELATEPIEKEMTWDEMDIWISLGFKVECMPEEEDEDEWDFAAQLKKHFNTLSPDDQERAKQIEELMENSNELHGYIGHKFFPPPMA